MDALQWMGAVRMRVQTADKNITIIHTTPVHKLISYEAKRCVFEERKKIHQDVYTFKLWSIILISHLNQERNMQRSSTVQNKCVDWCWCERTTGDGHFHLRKSFYWLWTHNLARSDGSKINALMMICFLQTQIFTSHGINWWTGVVWIIVMFLSAVWTLILTAPIPCRWCIGEQVM